MINEKLLELSNTYSIEELTSEDIMKLFEKPYLIEEILDAFEINEEEFNKIRKKLKITNIVFETIIRDLITILYFIYRRYPNIEKETIDEVIELFIVSIQGISHYKTYQKRLRELDFDIDVINNSIEEKNIDINYRKKRCIDIINKAIETIKHKMTQDEMKTYNSLLQNKNNGKKYTKKDLTYNILYSLAIKENISDSLIGDLFCMNKNQVKYIRTKYNLENGFLKRAINYPELYANFLERKGINIYDIYDPYFLYSIYSNCKELCEKKNWKIEILDKYVKDKMKEDKLYRYAMEPYINDIGIEYDVVINNNIKFENKNRIKNKSNGKKVNQTQANTNKILAGKLGEEIVFKYEKNKLKGLKSDKKPVLITQTEDKNITLDGLGYDIISFNEKNEKIYIEVKCSTTNFSNDVSFYISEKEVKLMNGQINGIDKEHCFIYYVHNINKDALTAEILIINSSMFSKLNLSPTMYKVN